MKDDITNKYYNVLFNSYCNARGIENNNKNLYSKDFRIWIKENTNELLDFWDYLQYLDLDNGLVEVGKGKLDSLYVCNVPVISLFAETMNKTKKELLIAKGQPIIKSFNKPGIRTEAINRTFLTHNPYFENTINDWPEIPVNSENNIIVGVYGKRDDEDKDQKEAMIEELANRINMDHLINFETDHDNYFASVTTIKTKKL